MLSKPFFLDNVVSLLQQLSYLELGTMPLGICLMSFRMSLLLACNRIENLFFITFQYILNPKTYTALHAW
jgi:hypothetical protein